MRRSRVFCSVGLFGGSLSACLLTAALSGGPFVGTAHAQKAPPALPPPPVPTEAKKDDKKKAVDPAELDKKTLDAAGLKADDAAGLIKYLRARALTEADKTKIEAIIKKMGGEAAFDDRLAAQEELIRIGAPAVSPLRLAAKDNTDPEIVYRAKDCIKRMEKEKSLGADVTTAVIRVLGRSKDPDALPALLGFLPLADNQQVIEVIQGSLRDATVGVEQAPKLLVDALKDASPITRRVVATALMEGGTAEKRVRFKEVQPVLVELAKKDPDADVRFAIARALVAECRDKEGVAVLIDLMPDMNRGQSWQAEELLVQIAGKDAPKERCLHTKQPGSPDKELTTNKKSRETTRDAWKKWWDGASAKVDLTKTEVAQTLKGYFVMATQFWGANGQQVLVTEYGQDQKERARYSFPAGNSLLDMAMSPTGQLFTLEHGANVVNVRDASGTATTWTVPLAKNARNNFQPKGLQMRENGNLVVIHACGVVEFDKDGKEAFRYDRELNKNPSYDIAGAVRMSNGNLVVHLNTNKLITLDEKGKEVEGRKPVQVGLMNQRSVMTQTGDDRVLVGENDKLVEYDLKTGKADGFRLDNIYNCMSVQRLPNGNILFADTRVYPQSVSEMNAAKQAVWGTPLRDNNQQITRALVR